VANALVYPLVLFCLSLGVVAFLVSYVVPSFSGLYEDLGRAIPVPTQILLAAAHGLRSTWPLWLAGAALLAVAVRRGAQTEAGRRLRDRALLIFPWAGDVLRRYALTQFCRTLAMVLGGGIPMMQALPVAVAAVENRHIRAQLEALAPGVAAGTPLATALEATGASPGLAVEMLAVGEQTGNLVDMLGNVAEPCADVDGAGTLPARDGDGRRDDGPETVECVQFGRGLRLTGGQRIQAGIAILAHVHSRRIGLAARRAADDAGLFRRGRRGLQGRGCTERDEARIAELADFQKVRIGLAAGGAADGAGLFRRGRRRLRRQHSCERLQARVAVLADFQKVRVGFPARLAANDRHAIHRKAGLRRARCADRWR